jgi:hypothetical protein
MQDPVAGRVTSGRASVRWRWRDDQCRFDGWDQRSYVLGVVEQEPGVKIQRSGWPPRGVEGGPFNEGLRFVWSRMAEEVA